MKLQKIIEGCMAKDARSQRLLVGYFSDLLYAICIRYMGSRVVAKDALQISLLKILNAIDRYDANKGPIESWVSTITINSCLTLLRQKKVEVINIDEINTNEPKVDENILADMSEKEILKLVSELPPLYREVFNLYVIDGYGHAEIAELVGTTEEASRARLARAKKVLRQELSKMKKQESWIGLA